MIEGKNIWFITFADSRFDSWKRLGKQAKELGWFDKIIAGDERMFDDWYREKYASRFSDRGFGYWQWKSYLIRRELDKLDEGDILLFCDGGHVLNAEGYPRLVDYVKRISTSNSGVMLFDQDMDVEAWTKQDLFAYFGDEEKYKHHGQINSGTIFLRKCANAVTMIDEWFYICHNHYELLREDVFHLPNCEKFVEHRYEQAVLDLLSIKYNADRLPYSEVYRVDEDWSKMSAFPIWQARQRDRKLSMKQKIKKILKWS